MRRVAVLAAFTVFLSLLAAACGPRRGPVVERPNLVLISVDTLRRDHLSTYGYGRETSPHLNRLAAKGVVFDTAIAAHTNTGPSHASILTGLYPPSHGITRNGEPIRPELETLAHHLRRRGYRSAAFVSGWTLSDEATGLASGFDVYDDDVGRRERRAPRTWKAAKSWLDAAADEEPWFLFFHLFDPHYPYRPPASFSTRWLRRDADGAAPPAGAAGHRQRSRHLESLTPEERDDTVRRYDAEIAFADHHLGLLLDELERRGLDDRTLIVFTSDHGETLTERPWSFDHGARLYDEQIRVPLVFRLPGGEHGGRRITAPVHHVDILPTVFEALGLPLPGGCQGRSLLPAIRGEAVSELERRPLFSLARSEPARLPELPRRPRRRGLVTAVRLPAVKLIEYPSDGDPLVQLFDLRADPGERDDLSAQRRELAGKLRREARKWHSAVRSREPRTLPDLTPAAEEALRALGYL